MTPLLYARAQMGLSLAFHIVFAAVGIALPLLMVIADALWMRTRDRDYLELTKRLAKGTGILFAVGAVSGTVLSFELGLLWPTFMGTFGPVIGLPFALEGLRLLHRGDLPGHLPLRARPGVGALSPVRRHRRRGQRRGVGVLRHAGERVHELSPPG